MNLAFWNFFSFLGTGYELFYFKPNKYFVLNQLNIEAYDE
jgi:hypothetical protein